MRTPEGVGAFPHRPSFLREGGGRGLAAIFTGFVWGSVLALGVVSGAG